MTDAPARRGRPRRQWSAEERKQAETLSGYGLPQKMIGLIMGCDEKTLRRHLGRELQVGEARATAIIGRSLFNKAQGGDVIAQIFWMKCRAGWREPPVDLRHAGGDGGPVSIVYSWADPPPVPPIAA